MGQQQLLLLVLSIVLVALAIVAGLGVYDTARRQNAGDALVTISTRIASEGIAWTVLEPVMGGGGGDPTQLTWSKLSIWDPNEDGVYVAGDGRYTLSATSERFVVHGEDPSHQMYAAIAAYGPRSECVVGAVGRNEAPEIPARPTGCSW